MMINEFIGIIEYTPKLLTIQKQKNKVYSLLQKMLLCLLIYLLTSNAVTLKQDKSILFSRIIIKILIVNLFFLHFLCFLKNSLINTKNKSAEISNSIPFKSKHHFNKNTKIKNARVFSSTRSLYVDDQEKERRKYELENSCENVLSQAYDKRENISDFCENIRSSANDTYHIHGDNLSSENKKKVKDGLENLRLLDEQERKNPGYGSFDGTPEFYLVNKENVEAARKVTEETIKQTVKVTDALAKDPTAQNYNSSEYFEFSDKAYEMMKDNNDAAEIVKKVIDKREKGLKDVEKQEWARPEEYTIDKLRENVEEENRRGRGGNSGDGGSGGEGGSSLIDDYADVSSEMPDYTGGDD